MAETAIWIDRIERLEVDGDGVRLWLNSDDAFVKLRMSRGQLRTLVERGRIELARVELKERNRIVPLDCDPKTCGR